VASPSKSFSAILFDLGGVLYDIDVQRSMDAFAAMGLKNFDHLYNLKEQTDLFDALEKGQIGEQEFEAAIAKHFPHKPEAGSIAKAWQALLIGMRKENIDILQRLRKEYRIYLASNTNILHLQPIDAELREKFGIPELRTLFDKAYFSFEMGLRKPDREFFDYIIRNARLEPSSTLFIDDNEDNVKGSRAAGLFALKMERNSDLEVMLKSAGVGIP
jgi:putative hydrolase of the HAD superfamily